MVVYSTPLLKSVTYPDVHKKDVSAQFVLIYKDN